MEHQGGGPVTAGVSRTVPALEVHKLQAFLQFDDHGLQPYWGVTNALDPGDDTGREFEALGCKWEIGSSTNWNGKIEHPEKNLDDGLYEYIYQLVADDDVGDRDATISLRAGYPRARHVETGDPIQSLPDDTPECLRVEVQTTNVDPDDLLELLRRWFEEMNLNPDYSSEPNEWSRITAYEGYVRVDRAESNAHLTGDGGLIQELAQFGSSDGDKGRYRWDHEKTQGHYEVVALDRGTWETLLPGQAFEKRLKSYHPDHVRSPSENDDPLYHPKLEVQMWQKQQSPVPWDERDALYDVSIIPSRRTVVSRSFGSRSSRSVTSSFRSPRSEGLPDGRNGDPSFGRGSEQAWRVK
jgi:hypothetical protein